MRKITHVNRNKEPIILLVGESGSGKSTIAKMSELKESVGYTSRAPREGEVDGVDYHFKDYHWMKAHHEVFAEMVQLGDNLYATSRKDLEECEVMVVNGEGAVALKSRIPAIIVWLKRDTTIDRGGDESKISPNLEALMEEHADYVLDNNGTIAEAIHKLEFIFFDEWRKWYVKRKL